VNLRLLAADGLVLPALSESRRELVLAVVRPLTQVAFGTLIVLSPFRARWELASRPDATVYGDYTDFLLYWSDIAFISLLALWGLSLLVAGRRPWLGPAAIRWPAIALLLASWASIPFSVDAGLSTYSALRLTGAVLLALYVANEVSLRQIAAPLVVMVGLQAVVGMSQAIDQASVGLFSLGEHHLDVNAGGTSVVWSDVGPRQLRAYGLTDHPNILGGLLAVSLLLIGGVAARARGEWTALFGTVFAIGCAALVLTFSRSAVLSLAVALVLVFGLLAYRRDRRAFIGWAGICIAAAVLCSTLVKPYGDYLSIRSGLLENGPTSSTEQRSISEREALAKATNEIFVSRPLLGVGAGGLPSAMSDRFPDFSYFYQPAHFALLTVAAETGLVGGMAYGALMVVPFFLLWWRRKELTPDLIAVSGALMALTVIGMLDYYTWTLAPGRILFWLVLGLWVAAYARRSEAAANA
jgi:O-antigen ligase